MPKHLRYGCASLALIAGTLAVPSTVFAQSTLPPENPESGAGPSAEQSGDAIVVTGSRIRRDPLSQDSPIVFVDGEDIAKTGLNSVNDVLQRLPSSGGGLNGKFNNSGNLGNPPDGGGVGAGAAEIDLRYLGSRRVLVLVDGIRFVNGASASGVPGSTDLNAIPESAIERIEVLQDGASAIYGSDAIAGVVNIITKKRQDGFLASAQIGTTDHGDGTTQNYQLSWGNKGDGPLQLVVGGNYVKSGGISAGARDISRFPAPYSNSCADGGCSGFLPNGRYAVFGQDLTLNAPVLGRPATPGDFRPFVSPDDRFNFGPFNYLQIPIERYGAFANLKYEVTPDINFSLRGIWNERKSSNRAAPLPFGVGVAAGITPVLDATTVDATNPYNPFGVTLDATNTDFIYRRFVEGGPRRFNQKVETIYGVATLDGKFQIGERDWYWDLNGTYGRNKAKQQMFGNIDSSKLRQALGPLAACTAPCVPFNLFGGAGSITQPMLDFVTFVQNDSSEQETWDFTGNISGSLFDLPGGPLGLAAGVEYRDLSGRFDPDPIVAAGFSSDIPARPTRGSYSVWEGYAELNAPLLSDRTFFQLLELNGAVRFSDYSTSGSTTTFKGGVNWKPIKDLRLRASYAEGFRAPSIGELFGTQSRFDQQLDDPCSSHPDNTAARHFANDATVRTNCIAAGVPANGSYQQANPQISVLVGGNEDLKPETSKSWVFGGVFSPSFLPRFSLEANYYDIKIRGAVQTVDAEVTVTNCIVDNDPAACALVTRAGAGQLTQVLGLLQNIAAVETDGIDVNLAYRTGETGAGRFGITWNNTFLLNYDVIVPITDGVQVISREGTEQGSPSQGFPKWKSVGILDWDLANYGVSLTGRYVSKLKEAGGNVMKARFYTDFQLRISAGEDDRFGFALGVNNVFDTKAPGCVTCDINNFDPTVYDLPGRYLYARATVKM
ncbi:TonB-dependent receptor [Sphingosinicella sp. BN140058]|uniref:TonB-dependent receptor n=1 Tax=Sphingosinicella sp. BN140058 TaxID=1892855 RepID=UPI001011B69B|nr:TonB-dependent receptor [Sphingosinicella sp. BN140058]QAY78871.1 TonB-dependent receptor [Sphingosinicella sp. BN140058]